MSREVAMILTIAIVSFPINYAWVMVAQKISKNKEKEKNIKEGENADG